MKITIFTIFLMTFSISIIAQNIPTRISYPDTLWAKSDTFFVKGSSWEDKYIFTTTQSDTIDLGTDGFEGINIKVWTDIDSVTIPYVNSPFEQWVFIPIVSKNDSTIYRLRFNPQAAIFSEEYIKENSGTSSFQIPETYELANIILYLSDCSNLTFNHPEGTQYTNNVEKHFGTFRNHPLVKILNKKCLKDEYWTTYYGFRENSICFKFGEDNLLEYTTPYKHSWSDNSDVLGGEFRNLLYLIQDFANATNFRKFFLSNEIYYKQLEKRLSVLQPINKMWKWLQQEFPYKFDAYKIVFSPLIIGSHSTQRFYKGFYINPDYQECVMFINSPEGIDAKIEYSEVIKEGLMSGIVFTEIDHNYVNPASSENIETIKKLLDNKDFWATKETQKNYQGQYSIFNEYMTHSLFCIYIMENYDINEANVIVNERIKLMMKRGFIKFPEFNDKLMSILKNRTKTVYELYPEIINQMQKIK